MTLGVQEVPKDETLRKFAGEANRIFRRYLTKIFELGYGWHRDQMGYFARGIDGKGRDTMVHVSFLAHHSENPNLLQITVFPGDEPKYASVYTEGEIKDMWHASDFARRLTISRITLPKEEFEGQAKAFSINYDKEPPYLEIIKNLSNNTNK